MGTENDRRAAQGLPAIAGTTEDADYRGAVIGVYPVGGYTEDDTIGTPFGRNRSMDTTFRGRRF